MSQLIERKKVESSNLVSIGYDAVQQLLQVEFKGGSVYNYSNVPEQLHASLMAPPEEFEGSHGKFFIAKIKKNPDAFPYEKIQDGEPKAPKAPKAVKLKKSNPEDHLNDPAQWGDKPQE